MQERVVEQYMEAQHVRDGAGVKMRRVFHRADTLDMEPFLMLDMFDSENPDDYIKGFPRHPHRGIQTLTYLIKGEIKHTDSLGNSGTIRDGEFQWMNGGSGILHEEMPQEVPHMFGYQLWINLPKKDKMSEPAYFEGTPDIIPLVELEEMDVRVLSGSFNGKEMKDMPGFIETEIYDLDIKANQKVEIPVK